MSNRYKRRVRALAAKLNISYQAADNMLKAGRRNGAPAATADGDGGDASRMQHAEEREAGLADSVQERDVEKDDVIRFGHPTVATQVAGWNALVATSALWSLLSAVADGMTKEGIELELTRDFKRKRPMTLRRSRLPRSGAEYAAALAATARIVGQEPPATFGELLLLLVRLGVVTVQAGRYTVAFPPPAPEETLPLTSEQRAKVLQCRVLEPNTGAVTILEQCVRAEGPGFLPPAWTRTVLEQAGVPYAS
jgi:hypothetical protein